METIPLSRGLTTPKVKFATESNPVKTSLKDGSLTPLSTSEWDARLYQLHKLGKRAFEEGFALYIAEQNERLDREDISNDSLSVASDDLSSADSSSSDTSKLLARLDKKFGREDISGDVLYFASDDLSHSDSSSSEIIEW